MCFNLTQRNTGDSNNPKTIIINAVLKDDETAINEGTIGLTGVLASKATPTLQWFVGSKTARFSFAANSTFYNNLTKYDELESLPFTITYSDKAGNTIHFSNDIKIVRRDDQSPVINQWTIGGENVKKTITHYDTDQINQTITLKLVANVYDERLDSLTYITKINGVQQGGAVNALAEQDISSIRPNKGSAKWGSKDDYEFILTAIDVNGASTTKVLH